jgi:hypothetical protein
MGVEDLPHPRRRLALIELRFSVWREAATFTADGQLYTLRRERGARAPFVLTTAAGRVASARKPSALRNRFEVDHRGGDLLIERAGTWRSSYRVSDMSGPIGEVGRRAWYSRVVEADLPDDLPLPVRVFVLWLVLVLFRCDESAGAAGAAGAGT